MQVAIPQDLHDFVEREIASGKFRSEDDIVSTALRLMRDRERKYDALRADLREGIVELDQGRGVDADEVFGRLRDRAAELGGQV